MKKLFLIPLMAMLCTAMAMATVRKAGTYDELQSALSAAANGDEIQLTTDIAYPTNGTGLINITKSITLDGQGHTIWGYGVAQTHVSGSGQNHKAVIAVNTNVFDAVTAPTLDVTIKNLTLGNFKDEYTDAGEQKAAVNARFYGIISYDGVQKMTIDNISIKTGVVYDNSKKKWVGPSNQQPLCFNGINTTPLQLTVKDSYIGAGNGAYPIYVLKPITATFDNTTTEGWCALYFKYRYQPSGAWTAYGAVAGTRGSVVTANNCAFNAPNIHEGQSNGFAVFPLEDDGITLNLNNCSMNAERFTAQAQMVFSLQYGSRPVDDENLAPVVVNISGDNTHLYNVELGRFALSGWNTDDDEHPETYTPKYKNAPLHMNITGGTFTINPENIKFRNYNNEGTEVIWEYANIPSTHKVETVNQGGTTLYRVVKKPAEKEPGVLYNLNDNVETKGAGENPVTSFELSSGEDMTLNQEVTSAGYVQIKDHATEGATTVIVDQTAGGDAQRLIINNGLDVQGESSVEVKPGAAVIIGEGGITTEDPSNIVIESTEEAQGVLLLDPTITVNQNPELTVKLKTHSKLNEKKSPTKWEYTYQRFAIPVMLATAGYVTNDFNPATNEYFDEEEASVGFESYVWQWTGMQWETTTWNALERSIGYQLSNNSKNGDVTYTFTGNLIGNTNTLYEFDVKGFKFFGNSYTAPIMIEELLKGFKEIYPDVEASVWVYNYANKGWKSVNLDDIAEGLAYATTIKSMDGFILNLRSANSGVAGVDYTSAIWNNPDINPKATPAPARRSNASTVTNGVIINVVASEVGDDLTLVEREDRNSSFENGADASKVMNESGLNIYAETPAGTLSRVATDNLLGTQITFDAIDEEQYTLSFSNVRGSSYALRDNVTEKVIELVEGGTYEFTQAANSSITNRFEIVAVANAPTAIDNVENNVKARGIYTVLGQYVGEASQWSTLPAGVYVVDGVKVVK